MGWSGGTRARHLGEAWGGVEERLDPKAGPKAGLASSTGQRCLHLSLQGVRVSFSPKALRVIQRHSFCRTRYIPKAKCLRDAPIPSQHHGNCPSGPCTQLSEELNQQLEAVCGSVFGELESQAVDALDLPGCFRMRSHSYLRAIQAGCSQDDDCLPLLSTPASVSGRPGSCEYAPSVPGPALGWRAIWVRFWPWSRLCCVTLGRSLASLGRMMGRRIRGSVGSSTWSTRGCWVPWYRVGVGSGRHLPGRVSHPMCLCVPWPQPSTSERPRPPSHREARPRPASPSPPRAAPTPPMRASPRQRAQPGAAAPPTGWTARPWARAPWSWRRCHPGPAPSPPHSSSRPFQAGRSCGAWRGSGSGGRPSGCRYGRRRRRGSSGPVRLRMD